MVEYPVQQYYDSLPRRGCPFLLGMLALAFLVIAVPLYVVYDSQCVRDTKRWMTDYPTAIFVSQEHSFIRDYGIGETTRVLLAPDDRATVAAWYDAEERRLNRERRAAGGAQIYWQFRAESSSSTRITMTASCRPSMALW